MAVKIAILSCGQLGVDLARALSEMPEVDEVRLFTTPYVMRTRSLWGRLRHAARMLGVWGALGAACRGVLRRLRGLESPFKPWYPSLNASERFSHVRFENFHDTECIEALKAFQPDLGLLAGTYILRDEVFTIPRLGCLNLHSGKAPEYRGAAPAFWELYHGEREIGITVHRVGAALDAGAIVTQELIALDPSPRGDPMEYITDFRRRVLYPRGLDLYLRTVLRLIRGEVEEVQQDEGLARTFRSPTARDVRELRRRVARRGTRRTVMRGLVKAVLGRLIAVTGLYRLLLRGRAVIVLFHRVPRATPFDPIGASLQSFRAFVAMASRYFEVVPVSELVGRLRDGRDVSGLLSITFDDGYLDNFEHALPALRERDLHATFFISTGFMGSDRVTGWDADLGVQSQWMTWDQVREMRAAGMEVAAHTVNHVDLGDPASYERARAVRLLANWGAEVDADQARWEIEESKRVLERELGEPIPLFSYPFGRVENLSEGNREAVRAAGFSCCFSAHGGLVDGATDPYDIPRVPYNWDSPWAFLADVWR